MNHTNTFHLAGLVRNIRTGSQFTNNGKLRSFSKEGKLLNLRSNQLRIMTQLITGNCHLKRHLLKIGLVDSPGCGRYRQVFETASHVLLDCEALAALRFRHLSHHF